MACLSRFGTALLTTGGLALTCLMGYTLWLDLGYPNATDWFAPAPVPVAAVVPERENWFALREGAMLLAEHGLGQVVEEGPDSLTIRNTGGEIRLLLTWHRATGTTQTRETVRRLLSGPNRPLAVIGSSNTILTTALACALQRERGPDGEGPLLLVPWATAILATGTEMSTSPTPLNQIYRGNTFRLCPDNRRQAELVVGCVRSQGPRALPTWIALARASDDPYSVDLAHGFLEALRELAPGSGPQPHLVCDSAAPGLGEVPLAKEVAFAREVWERATAGETVWVLLPLQGEPARRMLTALRDEAPERVAAPLMVLCGDGIGVDTLRRFAGTGAYSVWCVSADVDAASSESTLPPGALVPGEALLTVLAGLERARAARVPLRDAVADLRLSQDSPKTLGRSIAFNTLGERVGQDFGEVLAVRAGESEVLAFTPKPNGTWSGPRALPAARRGGLP